VAVPWMVGIKTIHDYVFGGFKVQVCDKCDHGH
jgi:hypothetical protein